MGLRRMAQQAPRDQGLTSTIPHGVFTLGCAQSPYPSCCLSHAFPHDSHVLEPGILLLGSALCCVLTIWVPRPPLQLRCGSPDLPAMVSGGGAWAGLGEVRRVEPSGWNQCLSKKRGARLSVRLSP